jgi:hypothetical protein
MQKYDTQNMTKEEIRALRRSIIASWSNEYIRELMIQGSERLANEASDAFIKMHIERDKRERERKMQEPADSED